MLLTILFGILIGLALGLTGGGGSIFAIPLLVFGLGLPAHEAITISLAAVTLVALFGAVTAARKRLIEFRAGTIFAVAGLATAPAGVWIAERLDETVILVAFAILMLVVAVSMWKKANSSPENSRVVRASFSSGDPEQGAPPCQFAPESRTLRLTAPCSGALSLTGVLTGILSGLFGVGGGFIIVPALTLITQLSIQRAVATSLYVITIIGFSGVISGVVAQREIDLHITGLFLAGGIAGMMIGQQVANRIAGPVMQKIFAVMMIVVALLTLIQRL